MNGKKAKKIGKEIYGDMSIKMDRQYVRNEKTGKIYNHPESPRAKYQSAKKGQ